MATKSFTTTMTFNRKNVDSLVKAIDNSRKANRTNIVYETVRDEKVIKNLFNSRKEKLNG